MALDSNDTSGRKEDVGADVALEEFFMDIEKLKISSCVPLNHDVGNHRPATDSSSLLPAQSSQRPQTNERKLNKKELIKRAETNRQSWQEFSVVDASSSRPDSTTVSTDDKPERPKISFAIRSKKGAKRKTTKTATLSSVQSKDSAPLPPPSLERPRWIAVLDTCALLQSYEAVCDLISAAVHSPLPAASAEPLTVVIPYKLWSELDYRSKEAEEEDQRYRARRAVRMLTEELNNNRGLDTTVDAPLRSQSRADMDQAACDFLTASRVKETNNDDHILFCARAEQKLHAESIGNDASPTGGVVLLTWDNVLSGKARADGVAVFTPVEFEEYYKR